MGGREDTPPDDRRNGDGTSRGGGATFNKSKSTATQGDAAPGAVRSSRGDIGRAFPAVGVAAVVFAVTVRFWVGRSWGDAVAVGLAFGLVAYHLVLLLSLGKGGRKRLAGIALGVFLCVVAVLIVIPWEFHGRREQSDPSRGVRSNLRQLGLALTVYANDSGGWSPAIEPEARQLANAAGVPGGAVLAFEDESGHWRASGLGLLWTGRYLTQQGAEVLGVRADILADTPLGRAFAFDEDEPFWTTRVSGPTDADGIGELPGHPNVMVSSLMLRCNVDNPWGARQISTPPGEAAVTRTVLLGETLAPEGREYFHLLFWDGCVKTWADAEDEVTNALEDVTPEDLDRVLDKTVFPTFFDPVYQED